MIARDAVIRAATRADAAAIACIYNTGSEDRIATFQTEHAPPLTSSIPSTDGWAAIQPSWLSVMARLWLG